MAAAAPQASALQEFVCPICLEYFKKPHALLPCNHVYCKTCLVQLKNSNINHCPQCRSDMTGFCPDDFMTHKMTTTEVQCGNCAKKMPALKVNKHMTRCDVSAEDFYDVNDGSHASTSQASLFKCPFCGRDDIKTFDLLRHCIQYHKKDKTKVVCPICASMPWGDPNQKSSNLISHLQQRHQFDYEEFVELWELDEDTALQRAVMESLDVGHVTCPQPQHNVEEESRAEDDDDEDADFHRAIRESLAYPCGITEAQGGSRRAETRDSDNVDSTPSLIEESTTQLQAQNAEGEEYDEDEAVFQAVVESLRNQEQSGISDVPVETEEDEVLFGAVGESLQHEHQSRNVSVDIPIETNEDETPFEAFGESPCNEQHQSGETRNSDNVDSTLSLIRDANPQQAQSGDAEEYDEDEAVFQAVVESLHHEHQSRTDSIDALIETGRDEAVLESVRESSLRNDHQSRTDSFKAPMETDEDRAVFQEVTELLHNQPQSATDPVDAPMEIEGDETVYQAVGEYESRTDVVDAGFETEEREAIIQAAAESLHNQHLLVETRGSGYANSPISVIEESPDIRQQAQSEGAEGWTVLNEAEGEDYGEDEVVFQAVAASPGNEHQSRIDSVVTAPIETETGENETLFEEVGESLCNDNQSRTDSFGAAIEMPANEAQFETATELLRNRLQSGTDSPGTAIEMEEDEAVFQAGGETLCYQQQSRIDFVNTCIETQQGEAAFQEVAESLHHKRHSRTDSVDAPIETETDKDECFLQAGGEYLRIQNQSVDMHDSDNANSTISVIGESPHTGHQPQRVHLGMWSVLNEAEAEEYDEDDAFQQAVAESLRNQNQSTTDFVNDPIQTGNEYQSLNDSVDALNERDEDVDVFQFQAVEESRRNEQQSRTDSVNAPNETETDEDEDFLRAVEESLHSQHQSTTDFVDAPIQTGNEHHSRNDSVDALNGRVEDENIFQFQAVEESLHNENHSRTDPVDAPIETETDEDKDFLQAVRESLGNQRQSTTDFVDAPIQTGNEHHSRNDSVDALNGRVEDDNVFQFQAVEESLHNENPSRTDSVDAPIETETDEDEDLLRAVEESLFSQHRSTTDFVTAPVQTGNEYQSRNDSDVFQFQAVSESLRNEHQSGTDLVGAPIENETDEDEDLLRAVEESFHSQHQSSTDFVTAPVQTGNEHQSRNDSIDALYERDDDVFQFQAVAESLRNENHSRTDPVDAPIETETDEDEDFLQAVRESLRTQHQPRPRTNFIDAPIESEMGEDEAFLQAIRQSLNVHECPRQQGLSLTSDCGDSSQGVDEEGEEVEEEEQFPRAIGRESLTFQSRTDEEGRNSLGDEDCYHRIQTDDVNDSVVDGEGVSTRSSDDDRVVQMACNTNNTERNCDEVSVEMQTDTDNANNLKTRYSNNEDSPFSEIEVSPDTRQQAHGDSSRDVDEEEKEEEEEEQQSGVMRESLPVQSQRLTGERVKNILEDTDYNCYTYTQTDDICDSFVVVEDVLSSRSSDEDFTNVQIQSDTTTKRHYDCDTGANIERNFDEISVKIPSDTGHVERNPDSDMNIGVIVQNYATNNERISDGPIDVQIQSDTNSERHFGTDMNTGRKCVDIGVEIPTDTTCVKRSPDSDMNIGIDVHTYTNTSFERHSDDTNVIVPTQTDTDIERISDGSIDVQNQTDTNIERNSKGVDVQTQTDSNIERHFINEPSWSSQSNKDAQEDIPIQTDCGGGFDSSTTTSSSETRTTTAGCLLLFLLLSVCRLTQLD